MKEVLKQPDILEQKKLNTSNSSNNCLSAAGEKSPVSYSRSSHDIFLLPKRFLIKEKKKQYENFLKKIQHEAEQQQKVYDLVNVTKKPAVEIIQLSDKVLHLKNQLKDCGKWVKKSAFCKQCEEVDKPALVSVEKVQKFCKIKYCSNPDCFVDRFADLIEEMKSITEFHGYKTLWHAVIGFEPISVEEFQNNFSKYRNRFTHVINYYFSKLRKKFVNLQGIKVLDLSFVKNGFVYPHYHLALVPVKKIRRGIVMKICQEVRIELIKNQKIKNPFHFQFLKHSKKQTTLSYLAVRSIGLYKYKEHSEFNPNKIKITKLKTLIEAGAFTFLDNFLTEEQYINHFWNRRSYTTFGGVSYGSIIRDNVTYKCKVHGIIYGRNEVRIEFEIIDPDKPPNKPPGATEKPVEVIKM